jgi:ornithine cyclodeaminase/alanine dehydrogenase-like protein (mu-crystallin family)
VGKEVVEQKQHLTTVQLSVEPLQPFFHDQRIHPGLLIVSISAAETCSVDVLKAAQICVLPNNPERNLQHSHQL